MSGAAPAHALAEDLFRRESARMLSALTRVLGPDHLALAEDVVQEALLTALQAWRFKLPDDPEAWLVKTARNRAIDFLRRDRRLQQLCTDAAAEEQLFAGLDDAFGPEASATDQLAMMFSCCHDELSQETQVTLILRFLCGLGPREIARAFLVDTQTVDRRIHRGRERLAAAGHLHDVRQRAEVEARLPSVLRALYLLFNEGYHGSADENPVRASICAEAIRLTDLLLVSALTASPEVHALDALFCLNAARLSTRLDADLIFVPLAEQDRTRWNTELIGRGVAHLASAAEGTTVTRWHLEAGIACEHTVAASLGATHWARIVDLYDALLAFAPGPIVELNRALAVAELRGVSAGLHALNALKDSARLETYPFYWAARADLERRGGQRTAARAMYQRAVDVARNYAERAAYQRCLAQLADT